MTPAPEPILRDRAGDRLPRFLNHGTWFARSRLRPSRLFKAERRVAVSLGTKDLAPARARRAAFRPASSWEKAAAEEKGGAA